MAPRGGGCCRMRLFPVITILGLGISVAFQGCSSSEATSAQSPTPTPATAPFDTTIENNVQVMFEEGRRIFRYDTFGDEVFWSETLGLHRAIAGENLGG